MIRIWKEYKKEYLIPTVKQFDGIMIWGYFTRKEEGPLVIIN